MMFKSLIMSLFAFLSVLEAGDSCLSRKISVEEFYRENCKEILRNGCSKSLTDSHSSNCPTVIYVDANAAAGGDGHSWCHAYNNLQSALDKAQANGGANEIWVAQGKYTPTVFGVDTIYGNRPSFTIPDQTSLYGGFKGNEHKRCDRRPYKYITILNADIENDDAPVYTRYNDPRGADYLPAAYTAKKIDNSRHVVTVLDADVVIDGFTITKGYAGDLPFINPSNSVAYRRVRQGGGLLVVGGAVTLQNIIFDDCIAYDEILDDYGIGGAILALSSPNRAADLTLNNIVTTQGHAWFFGASMSVSAPIRCNHLLAEKNIGFGCPNTVFSSGVFTDCIIRDNYTTNFCGGLELSQSVLPPTPSSVIDCLFENNRGGVCSGLELKNFTGSQNEDVLVKNTTFRRNRAMGIDDQRRTCPAICCYSMSFVAEGNVFDSNNGISSGAICVQDTSIIGGNSADTNVKIIDNCFKGNQQSNFDNNETSFTTDSLGGGAIHLIGSQLVAIVTDILNNKFYGNQADRNGGAIAVESNAIATISGNDFIYNNAFQSGDAVYVENSTVNNIIGDNSFKPLEANTVIIN